MQLVIFSFLFIAIVICAIWYHDVRHPPEEQSKLRARNLLAAQINTASPLAISPIVVNRDSNQVILPAQVEAIGDVK